MVIDFMSNMINAEKFHLSMTRLIQEKKSISSSPSGRYCWSTGSEWAGLYLYPFPYPSVFISLVGALRRCSGTDGRGPLCPFTDSFALKYAL